MIKLKSTGSRLHRLGLVLWLVVLAAELWILFLLFQDSGHPVSKTVLICFIILTIISLVLYYDRPVKNINRMLRGLEYREGTFVVRQGSRTLGPYSQEYLNRLTTAFSELVMERERQAHFFESILRINPSGILVISSDKKIRLYNESLVRILSIKEPVTYTKLEQCYPELTQLIETFDNDRQIVQKLKIEGVSTWISLTGSTLMLEGDKYQVIAVEDVQKVANKKEEETWEEMAKIIIHEVKNSLSPIRLLLSQFLDWFRQNPEGTGSDSRDKDHEDKLLNALESMEKRAMGLMDFVEGYKTLLHLPQPRKTRLSLEELINELLQLMHPEASQRGIQLTGTCTEEIFIQADSQQITQVLMNLVGNSYHFLEDSPNPFITVIGSKEGSDIIISIEDNGAGIPEELHEQIFTPFFSTRPGGTGIGLSFARKVISQHNGEIKLISRPGKTVFMVRIPVK